jgi:hypothetical protein
MNECPGRRAVDLIFLTAERMEVPPGHVIGVILVATDNDGIAGAAQPEVYVRLALLFIEQQPKDKLAPG